MFLLHLRGSETRLSLFPQRPPISKCSLLPALRGKYQDRKLLLRIFFLLDEEIILFHLQVKAPLDQPEDLLLPETPGSGLVSRHDVVSQGRKPLRHIQDVVVAGVSCAMSGQAPEQDRLAALQL